MGSSRGGFSAAGGQDWLSVKYCRWAPEVAFCNGQTFHSPQTYSPTPPLLFPAPGSTVPHLKAPGSTVPRLKSEQFNAVQLTVQASSARLELKTDNFPNFPNFSPNFSRKLGGGWKKKQNIGLIVKVEPKCIHQVALSGVPARSNNRCKTWRRFRRLHH